MVLRKTVEQHEQQRRYCQEMSNLSRSNSLFDSLSDFPIGAPTYHILAAMLPVRVRRGSEGGVSNATRMLSDLCYFFVRCIILRGSVLTAVIPNHGCTSQNSTLRSAPVGAMSVTDRTGPTRLHWRNGPYVAENNAEIRNDFLYFVNRNGSVMRLRSAG